MPSVWRTEAGGGRESKGRRAGQEQPSDSTAPRRRDGGTVRLRAEHRKEATSHDEQAGEGWQTAATEYRDAGENAGREAIDGACALK